MRTSSRTIICCKKFFRGDGVTRKGAAVAPARQCRRPTELEVPTRAVGALLSVEGARPSLKAPLTEQGAQFFLRPSRVGAALFVEGTAHRARCSNFLRHPPFIEGAPIRLKRRSSSKAPQIFLRHPPRIVGACLKRLKAPLTEHGAQNFCGTRPASAPPSSSKALLTERDAQFFCNRLASSAPVSSD